MQAMTEASADPPIMKNAGRLEPYGSTTVMMLLAVLGVSALVVGGMLLAVMISHGQTRRGWVLHAALGVVSLTLLTLSFALDTYSELSFILSMAAWIGAVWLLVAGMALAVGSLARPPGKPRRRAYDA